MKGIHTLGLIALSISFCIAHAESLNVALDQVTETGQGKHVGMVELEDTRYGLLITPHIRGLKPGLHGFHVHESHSCAHFGEAAGEHYDPKHTGHHLGPYNSGGHLGDLPALYVNPQGQAELSILAPRVTVKELKGHALMIHAGGDNYGDDPINGGAGKRIACGRVGDS